MDLVDHSRVLDEDRVDGFAKVVHHVGTFGDMKEHLDKKLDHH